MAEPADWERVGELLQQQRVTLDPRYRNRALFGRERGINYRLVQDIETGARDNYGVATLTQIEAAYGLPSGAILAELRDSVLTTKQRRTLEAFTAIVRSQREEREDNGGRATGS